MTSEVGRYVCEAAYYSFLGQQDITVLPRMKKLRFFAYDSIISPNNSVILITLLSSTWS